MSRKIRIKRKKRAQEAATLRQASIAYQKGELPASGSKIGLSVDFDGNDDEL